MKALQKANKTVPVYVDEHGRHYIRICGIRTVKRASVSIPETFDQYFEVSFTNPPINDAIVLSGADPISVLSINAEDVEIIEGNQNDIS